MKLRLPLYQQILISMLLSILFAYFYASMGWDVAIAVKYLKPLGMFFIKSLKLALIPLVISSLILGVSGAESVAEFSWIGMKTMFVYTLTTFMSVTLGVLIGVFVRPGRFFPEHMLNELGNRYGGHVMGKGEVVGQGMPDNLFTMLSHNANLLHIVVFSLICGLLFYRLEPAKRRPLVALCEGVRALFMEFMGHIMYLAPIGVFGIVASELIITGENDPSRVLSYLRNLFPYVGSVIGGLAFMTFLVYPTLVSCLTPIGFFSFIRCMYPAQLLAFTTSSSTAALRVTIERVTSLGVERKLSEAILSIGAVMNIDGTALYQGIAVLFISQAFGVELTFHQQLGVIVYVTIASMGEGGMPGGSLTGTAILLGILGIPEDRGLALIFLFDWLLDMCRSATNITSDAMVTLLIGSSEKKLTTNVVAS